MHVRSATVGDAQGIVKLNLAENEFNGWYRNPFLREGPCNYEDLTPFQRMLHGGYWMDVSICRRHLHEYISRGFPVFIAEEFGKIIGECELWIGNENVPFGRYAEIEMLISSQDSNREVVEKALVDKCIERCKKLDIDNIDVSPEHTGGSIDFSKLEFSEIWDTRECTAKFNEIEEPDFDFEVEQLPEDYSVTERYQHWNHREPSLLRFECILDLWPPMKLAGFDRHRKKLFMRTSIDALKLNYLVAAWRSDWTPQLITEVDIWSDKSIIRRKKLLQAIVKSTAAIVERLGEGTMMIFIPKQALPALRELGFKGGEKPDPWLRKRLDISRQSKNRRK